MVGGCRRSAVVDRCSSNVRCGGSRWPPVDGGLASARRGGLASARLTRPGRLTRRPRPTQPATPWPPRALRAMVLAPPHLSLRVVCTRARAPACTMLPERAQAKHPRAHEHGRAMAPAHAPTLRSARTRARAIVVRGLPIEGQLLDGAVPHATLARHPRLLAPHEVMPPFAQVPRRSHRPPRLFLQTYGVVDKHAERDGPVLPRPAVNVDRDQRPLVRTKPACHQPPLHLPPRPVLWQHDAAEHVKVQTQMPCLLRRVRQGQRTNGQGIARKTTRLQRCLGPELDVRPLLRVPPRPCRSRVHLRHELEAARPKEHLLWQPRARTHVQMRLGGLGEGGG